MIDLSRSGVLLFQGDSITDAGRRDSPDGLGFGYVSMIAGILGADPGFKALKVLNRGISGDRTTELAARWDEDCLDLKPDALSVMVGVNDVWRLRGEWNGQSYIGPKEFRANYRALLERAKGAGIAGLILMSPTTIENEKDAELSALLDEEAGIVRELAREFGAAYVDAREEQKRVLKERPDILWTTDGCHPSLAGHAAIASTWLRATGFAP
jgi:lysophospholipase L1-like esterase